jgi:serine/threonine-protein kinase
LAPVTPLRSIEGKYEILEKLGEGGMGSVYKVRHRLLDEIRVVKVMRPQLTPAEDLAARFSREAKAATLLRHPNIAQLYDFSLDDDGFAFIVMEYIPGMTLQASLRHNGPLPLGLALEVAQQSLRALAFLHGKGFVHRDISPDNLMLARGEEGEPVVKIIDLGIAKALASGAGITNAGMFVGKVRYAPPEQFRAEGAAAVDARGDLYSFMVVLYELLTGRFPIQGKDPSSIIAGHLFFPPLDFAESDPAERVPVELRQVVLKGLAKDAADRFATAQDLSRALAPFRAGFALGAHDLVKALEPVTLAEARPQPPGSTQIRLDQQFDLHTTPSPRNVLETLEPPGTPQAPEAPEEAATAQRAEALHELVSGVADTLSRGAYRAAERQLFDAEIEFGQQKVFLALHERIADLRRRDLAAKAEARRRAEEVAAAAAEVEGRLGRGDVERASRALDEAVARFGDEAPFARLRSRLEDLRRTGGSA